MILIEGKRIRTPLRHLSSVVPGSLVVATAPGAELRLSALARAGFPDPATAGDRVLPARVGPVTRRNAEGWYVIHRDRPKETVYRQVSWTRKEWHGKEQREVETVVDVPYQRYPRTHFPPPSVELTIVSRPNGSLSVVAPEIRWDPADTDGIKHQINVLLELFGIVEIMDPALGSPPTFPRVNRVNWEILPKGRHPWNTVGSSAHSALARLGPRTRPVAQARLHALESHQPDTVAVGIGGFAGYLAFEFKTANVVVLESLQWGNALYTFDSDWQGVSRLTKAEILDEHLHKDRIVHRSGWETRLSRLLESTPD